MATEQSLTNATYHAMPEISASALKVFREDRLAYYRRYVAKTEPFPPPTPQMQIGTATHMAVLEPEKFAKKVAAVPAWCKTKKLQEGYARTLPKSSMVLEANVIRRIQIMAEACRDVAGDYLAAPGKIEASFFATDEATGLKLKGRCDKCIECADGSVFVFDLKTTSRIDTFGMSYLQYGYDLQEAQYLEICRQFYSRPIVFRFLLVQTTPPHVAVWRQTTDNTLAAAQASWRKTLDQLAECYATGKWEPQNDCDNATTNRFDLSDCY